MTPVNIKKWDAYLELRPNAHILQTSAWGLFKQNHGWYPKYLLTDEDGNIIDMSNTRPIFLNKKYNKTKSDSKLTTEKWKNFLKNFNTKKRWVK